MQNAQSHILYMNDVQYVLYIGTIHSIWKIDRSIHIVSEV